MRNEPVPDHFEMRNEPVPGHFEMRNEPVPGHFEMRNEPVPGPFYAICSEICGSTFEYNYRTNYRPYKW